MRIMLVAYLGTKREDQHHTGGVVFGVLIRMVLTYGFIIEECHLNQMVVLLQMEI